jgi:hypothetical protein
MEKSISIKGNKEGSEIIVTLTRGLIRDTLNLDGHEFGTRITGSVDHISVNVISGGKSVAHTSGCSPIRTNDPNYRQAKANGYTHRVGNVYLKADKVEQIEAAIAQLEAENPKSDEQVAWEEKSAAALKRAIAYENSEDYRRHEQFKRDMEDENSIY